MAITRSLGSGADGLKKPGLTDSEICEMITTQMTMAVMEAILRMFGSVKTAMIEMFDERYVVVTEVDAVTGTTIVATAGVQGIRMV